METARGADVIDYMNTRRGSRDVGAPYRSQIATAEIDRVEAILYCADGGGVVSNQIDALMNGWPLDHPHYLAAHHLRLNQGRDIEKQQLLQLRANVQGCADRNYPAVLAAPSPGRRYPRRLCEALVRARLLPLPQLRRRVARRGTRALGDEATQARGVDERRDALLRAKDPLRPIAYVDIGSIDSTIGITEMEEMVFEDAPSRARRLVRDGDTIVSTVRTYLRAIAPVSAPPPEMVVSTGFAVIRPRVLAPGFASWALREQGIVEEIVARSTGVSYPAINASEIGDLPIHAPTPRRTARHRRVPRPGRRSASDALVAKKRVLIERLEEYRTALIRRTVTRGLPREAARAAGLDPSPPLQALGRRVARRRAGTLGGSAVTRLQSHTDRTIRQPASR